MDAGKKSASAVRSMQFRIMMEFSVLNHTDRESASLESGCSMSRQDMSCPAKPCPNMGSAVIDLPHPACVRFFPIRKACQAGRLPLSSVSCSEAPASEHTALEAPASTARLGGRSLRAVRSRAGALERGKRRPAVISMALTFGNAWVSVGCETLQLLSTVNFVQNAGRIRLISQQDFIR